MPTEKLEFNITLSGTYWDKKPQFAILINGVEQHRDIVSTLSDETFNVTFSADLEEEQVHVLSISLLNKTDLDTLENSDKTGIEKDMLLNIVDVEIDGISLGTLKWSNSEYIVPHLDRTITNCVNLGWNGSWNFKFSSPFYIWLLENM